MSSFRSGSRAGSPAICFEHSQKFLDTLLEMFRVGDGTVMGAIDFTEKLGLISRCKILFCVMKADQPIHPAVPHQDGNSESRQLFASLVFDRADQTHG